MQKNQSLDLNAEEQDKDLDLKEKKFLNVEEILAQDLFIAIVKGLHEEEKIPVATIISSINTAVSRIIADQSGEFQNALDLKNLEKSAEERRKQILIANEKIAEERFKLFDEFQKENDYEAAFQASYFGSEILAYSRKASQASFERKYKEWINNSLKVFQIAIDNSEEWKKMLLKFNEKAPETIGNGSVSHKLMECANSLMRGYVILENKKGMEDLIYDIRVLSEKLGEAEIHLDWFESSFNRFYNDISKFQKIIDFLKSNPDFPQNKIFKELSLDGRQCKYMIDWGENLGRISRKPYNSTWLLTACELPEIL